MVATCAWKEEADRWLSRLFIRDRIDCPVLLIMAVMSIKNWKMVFNRLDFFNEMNKPFGEHITFYPPRRVKLSNCAWRRTLNQIVAHIFPRVYHKRWNKISIQSVLIVTSLFVEVKVADCLLPFRPPCATLLWMKLFHPRCRFYPA